MVHPNATFALLEVPENSLNAYQLLVSNSRVIAHRFLGPLYIPHPLRGQKYTKYSAQSNPVCRKQSHRDVRRGSRSLNGVDEYPDPVRVRRFFSMRARTRGSCSARWPASAYRPARTAQAHASTSVSQARIFRTQTFRQRDPHRCTSLYIFSVFGMRPKRICTERPQHLTIYPATSAKKPCRRSAWDQSGLLRSHVR